jgi:alcohol dehydrogenase class IV
MTQQVYFGSGAITRLPRALRRSGARRLFLVTGRHSFTASGAAEALQSLCRGYEIVHRFCEFTENPRIEEVERGIEAFRRAGADLILAVGGGSVLDMAKAINALSGTATSPREILLGSAPVGGAQVPLVAVPTTSGSGSEATHFAVVYVGKSKYSLASPGLLPGTAIVDPDLTASLPPHLTAVSGLDAFAQAVESYWSVHSTGESKACARRAVALVLRYLQAAVSTPTDDARRGMSKAAHLAGRAINITKTTGAHALSYPLTSHFGIPHGHAVCLTLGQWLLFNSQVTDSDVTDRRGAPYVRRTVGEIVDMMQCHDAGEGCRRIEELTHSLGLETRLAALGISRTEAMNVVARNVNLERLANNPRGLTRGSLESLLEAVC